MRIALATPTWLLKNDYPPLGLAYLAAALENAGHEIKIFDFTLEPRLDFEGQAHLVCNYSPQVLGIGMTTNAYLNGLRLAEKVKEKNRGIVTVAGGPHPTIFPEQVLRNARIDFVVSGEGESTLLELAQGISSSADLSKIEGLSYKDSSDRIHTNPARPLLEELDRLPFPSRHLFDLKRYENSVSVNGRPMATILTSRGCPFSCVYCYKGIFGSKYRARSPASIIAEIKYIIDKFGINSFYFIDDLFVFDRQRIMEFCGYILEEGLKIEWQCLSRVDLVDSSLLAKMRQAGCDQIFYGIESGNSVIIRQTKGITIQQVQNAVKWAREAGIYVSGYFMLGLPSETSETMRQTIDFARSLDIDSAMFSVATPFPGTRLWDSIQKGNGYIKESQFANAFYHGIIHEAFVNLSSATDRQLSRAYRKAILVSSDLRLRYYLARKLGRRAGFFAYCLLRFPARIVSLRHWGKMVFKNLRNAKEVQR